VKKKIIYIADFSLPNQSAYTIHVLKMCDAFTNLNYDVSLIVFSKKNTSFNNLKKKFLLKNHFKIVNIYKNKKKLNIVRRMIFSFKILKFLNLQKNIKLIYSRSIIPSLILAFSRYKNILEIHTEMTGITKIIFNLRYFLINKKYISFVIIHKYLKKKLRIYNNIKILDDAVNINNFKFSNKDEYRNRCVYTGSFVRGKSVELISKIAKKTPNINYDLYGNIGTLNPKNDYIKKQKNIFLKGYAPYNQIPRILNKYPILLMPYQSSFVGVLIDSTNVSKYFSPLKLFDYLAAGKIILASNLNAYSHILKHKKNSILINSKSIDKWCYYINTTLKNRKKFNNLRINAFKTARSYTWDLRVEKILEYYEKK